MIPAAHPIDLWLFPHPGTRRIEVPLQTLLSRYVPGPIDIRRTPSGKPHLHPLAGCHFSISHTTGLSIIAIARLPLGVDVESLMAPPGTLDGIVRYLPAHDRRRLQRTPPALRNTAILTAWTRFEARAKAAGLGVAVLDYPCSPDLDRWQLHPIPLPGYAAALAIPARHMRLRTRQWPDPQ